MAGKVRDPAIARALGQVTATLGEHLPAARSRIMVACSGGPDSVATLALLRLLSKKQSWSLVLGHIHHGLREASDSEAALVRQLALKFDLEVAVTRLELARGAGLPARARRARRTALREQADKLGATQIALGHTATDQTETVLMHLTRGAGLDGLAAMPVADGLWVRPVLGISRDTTRELCQLMDLPFVDDPTNRDRSHLRVRIREVVLPLLREQNPKLDAAVGSLATIARDADRAINSWVARELAARRVTAEAFSWRIDGFAELPRAVRTGFIRAACRAGGAGLEACGRAKVAEIERSILVVERTHHTSSAARKPRRWQLTGGLQVCVNVHGLHLTNT